MEQIFPSPSPSCSPPLRMSVIGGSGGSSAPPFFHCSHHKVTRSPTFQILPLFTNSITSQWPHHNKYDIQHLSSTANHEFISKELCHISTFVNACLLFFFDPWDLILRYLQICKMKAVGEILWFKNSTFYRSFSSLSTNTATVEPHSSTLETETDNRRRVAVSLRKNIRRQFSVWTNFKTQIKFSWTIQRHSFKLQIGT